MRWVITGAGRGIGLELVRQLAERGDSVEAFLRKPSDAKELQDIIEASGGRVRAFACEVASDASVSAAAAAMGDVAVDVLVNNAGTSGEMRSFSELVVDDLMRTFDVNALGPIRVTKALLDKLLRSETRKVVSITSGMGSIGDNTRGGAYGYRMSKAALNMAMKSLSLDFKDEKLTVVVMNPGWVKTDMGGEGAPTPVSESVSKMLARIDALTPEDTGTFLNYRGGTLPW